jgi:uncharacterized membrane protein
MTVLAIVLVLSSALFHALWNYVAKKAEGGAPFVWLFGTMELVLYFPVLLYFLFIEHPNLSLTGIVFIIGSGILHLMYFLLLSKAYQVGDLSIVYPLARGIGPLLAVGGAILLFGERPSAMVLSGGVMICGGVFWLTGDPRRLREREAVAGAAYAGLTGLAIAAYTLWDAYAVADLGLGPLIFQWGLSTTRSVLLTPYAVTHREMVKAAWKKDQRKIIFVAIFSSLSYILILVALAFSPVSSVAPMRVISTLVGVLMGSQLLGEGDTRRRLSAAGIMLVGVVALSVG